MSDALSKKQFAVESENEARAYIYQIYEKKTRGPWRISGGRRVYGSGLLFPDYLKWIRGVHGNPLTKNRRNFHSLKKNLPFWRTTCGDNTIMPTSMLKRCPNMFLRTIKIPKASPSLLINTSSQNGIIRTFLSMSSTGMSLFTGVWQEMK